MVLTACDSNPNGSTTFDVARWHAHPPETQPQDNPRYAMAGDLVARWLKRGLARSEVHALIGPPDHAVDQREVWLLGFPPLRMDPATLVVDYDDAGRIVEARVQLN